MHPSGTDGTRAPAWPLDKYALVPILACIYATIVFPLIIASCSLDDSACLMEARPESKIFWPALALISVVWAAKNFSRLRFPPLVVCLFVYLGFAGLSVLWAFKPELSFVRFAQQAMIVTCIIVPAMLASRNSDLVRGLFLCFAIAAVLNLVFVFIRPPVDFKNATWGYPGYFAGKNYLGECATLTLLLAIYEIVHPGKRRVFGIIIGIVAVAILILSNSKTSMGLAVLAPLMAGVALLLRRKTRISPALALLSIPVGFYIFSSITGFSVYRLSNILYGDPTFTGRSVIWEFIKTEIDHRPLLGWGYQSFWLAGPDAPSIVNAPGWVKDMPNAHNGYYDTLVELGYIGYALLLAFIIATLHAIGRVADRAPLRAWLLLSLAIHVIITNGLETLWMRGFEMLWVVFLIIAAETARYWTAAAAPARAASAGRNPRPVNPSSGPRRPASVRLHPAHAARLAATLARTSGVAELPDGTKPTTPG